MRLGILSLAAAAGLALALFVTGGSIAGTNPDSDGDGVFNLVDNCKELANPPCTGAVCNANPGEFPRDTQTDTDGDGFGNRCDADFNNNGIVNTQDNTVFLGCFGAEPANIDTLVSFGIPCRNADLNNNSFVNTQDNTIFLQLFQPTPNGTLGPSGLTCALKDAGSPNLTGRLPCEFDPTPND